MLHAHKLPLQFYMLLSFIGFTEFTIPLREALNCEKKSFMKSLFIFFSDHFLIEKKDDFEGCWKGVDECFIRVLEGCCRVFEMCLKGIWKSKIEV